MVPLKTTTHLLVWMAHHAGAHGGRGSVHTVQHGAERARHTGHRQRVLSLFGTHKNIEALLAFGWTRCSGLGHGSESAVVDTKAENSQWVWDLTSDPDVRFESSEFRDFLNSNLSPEAQLINSVRAYGDVALKTTCTSLPSLTPNQGARTQHPTLDDA